MRLLWCTSVAAFVAIAFGRSSFDASPVSSVDEPSGTCDSIKSYKFSKQDREAIQFGHCVYAIILLCN